MIKKIVFGVILTYIEKIWLAMIIAWFAGISIIGMMHLYVFQDFLHSLSPIFSSGTGKMSCQSFSCIIYTSTKEYMGLWWFLFFVIGIIEVAISIYRKRFFSLSELYLDKKNIKYILIILYIISILWAISFIKENVWSPDDISQYFISIIVMSIFFIPNIVLWSFLFFWSGKMKNKLYPPAP